MKVLEVQGTGGLENLKIVDKPDPVPGDGEILVRWHATSLNYHDYLVAAGFIKVAEGRIPMSDGAGEIVKVGPSVEEWKVGDKVMSMFFPNWINGLPSPETTKYIAGESIDGCMSELAILKADAVTHMPKNYSYAEASCLPTAGLTAWNALMEINDLVPGEKVLIEGTGGMSMMATQFALAQDAIIYATTSSEVKAQKLKDQGCHHIVNYKEDEKWGKSIFKHSEGGVNYVLDVGGGSTMVQSIEASKMNGHIIAIGILGNGRKGQITFPKLFFKFLTLQGIAVGNRAMQNRMVDYIDKHDVKPIVDRSFAFDQLVEAFNYQLSGQQFGKIVVEW